MNWLDVITFSPSVAHEAPHHHRNERVVAPPLNPLRFQLERSEWSNPTATAQSSLSGNGSSPDCPNRGKFQEVPAAVKLHEKCVEKVLKCDSEGGRTEKERREVTERVTLTPSTHIQNSMTEERRRKGAGERQAVQKVSGPVAPVLNRFRQTEIFAADVTVGSPPLARREPHQLDLEIPLG